MKTLRLSLWHLGIWLGLAACAAAMSVSVCLSYNEVAGTDKTPGHIACIAVAVMAGPMVGPVANPGSTGFRSQTVGLTVVLGGVLLVSLSPFVFRKAPVSKPVFAVVWAGFVLASVVWFFGAIVSLGAYLS
jgi:hypothetical protein